MIKGRRLIQSEESLATKCAMYDSRKRFHAGTFLLQQATPVPRVFLVETTDEEEAGRLIQ